MISLQNIAWHHIIGRLINQLDNRNFWILLIRQLKKIVPFDSWVIFLFSNHPPHVFAESPNIDGTKDHLFKEYLQGFYLIDPFYIHNRGFLASGLFLLDDIAPEYFERTEYYQRYFQLNIVADELQINYQIDKQRTLCISLGSKQPFTIEQIATIKLIKPWLLGLMKQRFYFEQNIASPNLLTSYLHNKPLNEIQNLLSSREFEVSCLLLSGYSTKEISRKLAITAETVKAHRKHIYTKLNIHSQAELFSRFLQENRS